MKTTVMAVDTVGCPASWLPMPLQCTILLLFLFWTKLAISEREVGGGGERISAIARLNDRFSHSGTFLQRCYSWEEWGTIEIPEWLRIAEAYHELLILLPLPPKH